MQQRENIDNARTRVVSAFESLKKNKESHEANKAGVQEVRDQISKCQQEVPLKKKELDKLTQKSSVLAQKVSQSGHAAYEAEISYDSVREEYLSKSLSNFQQAFVDWTATQTLAIKKMLIQMKQLEKIAIEKAAEANNVGKESMQAINVIPDVDLRKISTTSIRDMHPCTMSGKLYVKRNDSPLSPWSIQYSVLKDNRLYMFDKLESEQPKEVIFLAKPQSDFAPVLGEPAIKPSPLTIQSTQQQLDKVFSDFAIIHEAHQSFTSMIPLPLLSEDELTFEATTSSNFLFSDNDGQLGTANARHSIRNGVDSHADRRYYFMPVSKEPSAVWIDAFSHNGAKNCWCGNCLLRIPSQLSLHLWIIEGNSLGVERGSNDNFSVMVKFGGLKMSRTAFKPGPNPSWHDDNLTSCTKSIHLSVNSGLNIDNGDSELGSVLFSLAKMSLERRIEATHPLESSNSSSDSETTTTVPSIKLAYLLTTNQTLPLESYQQFISILTAPPLDAFHFISSSLPHDIRDEFYDIFLNLLIALSDPMLPAMTSLIHREISNTEDSNILFRGNSVLTKILERFMRIVGSNYVKEVLENCVGAICRDGVTYEIDPNKISPVEELEIAHIVENNWKGLLAQIDVIWGAIQNSVDIFPMELKVIFSRMKAILKLKYTEEKCQHIGLSGFLFLRLFCVAILAPKRFGIVESDPDVATLRTLTFITKIIQHLANFSQFGAKERYMEPSNEWINANSGHMREFLDKIASLSPDAELLKVEEQPSNLAKSVSAMHRYISTHSNSLTVPQNAPENEIFARIQLTVDKLNTEMEQITKQTLLNAQEWRFPLRNRSKYTSRASKALSDGDSQINLLQLEHRKKTQSAPVLALNSPKRFDRIKTRTVLGKQKAMTLVSPNMPNFWPKSEKEYAAKSRRTSAAIKSVAILRNRNSWSADSLNSISGSGYMAKEPRVASVVPFQNSTKKHSLRKSSPATDTDNEDRLPTPKSPTSPALVTTPLSKRPTSEYGRQGLTGFMSLFKNTPDTVVRSKLKKEISDKI
ncbi:hypothetical protein HK100_012489 [Physocladia obscura]|uniref:Ras-GAP domain-containing protein n=1 Tax=Physocladia obscura TaxID=109957 RepID=A0AAD5T8I4_9FUNG|nr:hypothetical protein HK100_012489 [Physocladia obscura]